MAENRQSGAKNVGMGLLIYAMLFLIPWINSLKMQLSYGKPIAKIFSETIYYARLYKLIPFILIGSGIWLSYLISAIGILRQKQWGKLLAIWATSFAVVLTFGTWVYQIYNGAVNPVILSGSPARGFGALMCFLILIIPIGMPSLIFLIFLTRSNASKQSNS